MSMASEEVLELIRMLPVAMQEGYQESVELIKHVVNTAITEGTPAAMRELQPIMAGLAGFHVAGAGSPHRGMTQAAMLADLKAQSHGLEDYANKWVRQSKEAHLSQAMHRLTFISQHSPGIDDRAALDLVHKIIVTMRTSTKGGMVPGADGSRRPLTPSEHKLVVQMAPEVIKLLNRLEKEKQGLKKHPQLHLYIAEALGFNLGTQGLMSQARALDQVARMSRSIDVAMKTQPSLDSGMPHVIRGMFHLNCPPPLKSVPKARECFHRALQINPKSGRNLYFCGVAAYLEKEYDKAVQYYTAAQEALVHEVRRDPQYGYLEPECRRGLELAKDMAQRHASK